MCNFCKNIITDEKYRSLSSCELIDLPISFIMKNNVSNQYDFWIECDDILYSGAYLEDIKYCPKCGRKLLTS